MQVAGNYCLSAPIVITTQATNLTAITATIGGNVTHDGGVDVTERGVYWGTSPNPQTTGTQLPIGDGAGEFYSTLIGLSENTQYYFVAYATNSIGTAYGDNLHFTTNISNFICGTSMITDVDDNTYNTVLIGTQCWMAENLKTTRYRNGTAITYPGSNNTAWINSTTGAYAWYNNNISWKASYGALYNWYAAANSNGLCPTGWHVPTDAEWTQLVNYVVAQGFPNSNVTNGTSNAFKSCRQVGSPLGGSCNTTVHPRWEAHSAHYGTNNFGFSALPGGNRNTAGTFDGIGYHGYWWSSTEYSSASAWGRYLGYDLGYVDRSSSSKAFGFSVRCLRD